MIMSAVYVNRVGYYGVYDHFFYKLKTNIKCHTQLLSFINAMKCNYDIKRTRKHFPIALLLVLTSAEDRSV